MVCICTYSVWCNSCNINSSYSIYFFICSAERHPEIQALVLEGSSLFRLNKKIIKKYLSIPLTFLCKPCKSWTLRLWGIIVKNIIETIQCCALWQNSFLKRASVKQIHKYIYNDIYITNAPLTVERTPLRWNYIINGEQNF